MHNADCHVYIYTEYHIASIINSFCSLSESGRPTCMGFAKILFAFGYCIEKHYANCCIFN